MEMPGAAPPFPNPLQVTVPAGVIGFGLKVIGRSY